MPAKMTDRDGTIRTVLDETETLDAISSATTGLYPALVASGNPNGLVAGLLGQRYFDQAVGAEHWYVCISNPAGTVWILE